MMQADSINIQEYINGYHLLDKRTTALQEEI